VMKFIFILHGMHGPMSVLIHSTLLLFTILSISKNGGLSWSWHVFHSLPAHLRPMDPIHHHCLQYTYSTTDSTLRPMDPLDPIHHHCLQYTYSTTGSTLRPKDPIHHHCLQYTYSTTDSTHLPINCSRLISIDSKKLNHHPLVLFGQINQLVSYF